MCGIAAVINGDEYVAASMGAAIHRRGTHSTITSVENLTVYFTHLPITNDDYSQPCRYKDVTLWLNGYISNWNELCSEFSLIAESDTELLVWWVSHKMPLERLNGFFAVLYHDSNGIHYFTDRYGIKQLYIFKQGRTTYICSEVKGIKAVVNLKVDFDGLQDWNHSLGVMNPNTIYAGVRRVERLPFPKPNKREVDYETAKRELKRLWLQSVERNRYDGAGCYLSGGVDSGIIAKWLNPKYCFSMDYLNELSEVEGIKENSTGIHFTMICNEHFRNEYASKTFNALDDLKAGSCYTNFALAELASKHCKVVYSGAGGDEVFNGYTHRYSRLIEDVIKRAETDGKHYDVTHKEYDWKFLQAVLVVEDRMGGYHTMETRYPLLDNDFVDYALSLPNEYLDNKRILKDISGLSETVLNGKKRGFSNPHFNNQQWIDLAITTL